MTISRRTVLPYGTALIHSVLGEYSLVMKALLDIYEYYMAQSA